MPYYKVISNLDFKKEQIVCLCGSKEDFIEATITACPCCDKLSYFCNECQNVYEIKAGFKPLLLDNKSILIISNKIHS